MSSPNNGDDVRQWTIASADRHRKPAKDGFILIDRSDYKIQELWKVDRINAPNNVDNINPNEGDIIMQMLDSNGKQFIWIRLPRRAGNAID